ncbi:MAG: hypothetical protein QM770_02635 [Tepidisphaeraceae bacterium]
MSYSSIPFYRYVIPVTAIEYVAAALGVVWVADVVRHRSKLAAWGVFVVGVAVVGWQQGLRCADHTWQFAHDSRNALRDWVNDSVPSGTLIVADNYTCLDGYGFRSQRLRQEERGYTTAARVTRTWSVADWGDVDTLRGAASCMSRSSARTTNATCPPSRCRRRATRAATTSTARFIAT